MAATETLGADEQRLAELGYKQELRRGWSSFSNFAISFSIICISGGCFTTYGQAFNDGGPVAISIGWPVISVLILAVGFSMSELASAMPTAGGIYYWASKLGGPGWGWFTGWFNLIGLVAVVASVDYAAASFLSALLGLFNVNFVFNFASTNVHYYAHVVFAMFAIILIIHGLINVFSSPPGRALQRDLRLVDVLGVVGDRRDPDRRSRRTTPASRYVFGHRQNFTGFNNSMYWFYILPLGFLLTMYTITGYDASAHLCEETHGAADSAAKGVWRSVSYSAVFGWIVLLAITFAVQTNDIKTIRPPASRQSAIFETAMSAAGQKP